MLIEFFEGPSEEEQAVGSIQSDHCPRIGERVAFRFPDHPTMEYIVTGVRWQVDVTKEGGAIKTIEERLAVAIVELDVVQ